MATSDRRKPSSRGVAEARIKDLEEDLAILRKDYADLGRKHDLVAAERDRALHPLRWVRVIPLLLTMNIQPVVYRYAMDRFGSTIGFLTNVALGVALLLLIRYAANMRITEPWFPEEWPHRTS